MLHTKLIFLLWQRINLEVNNLTYEVWSQSNDNFQIATAVFLVWSWFFLCVLGALSMEVFEGLYHIQVFLSSTHVNHTGSKWRMLYYEWTDVDTSARSALPKLHGVLGDRGELSNPCLTRIGKHEDGDTVEGPLGRSLHPPGRPCGFSVHINHQNRTNILGLVAKCRGPNFGTSLQNRSASRSA